MQASPTEWLVRLFNPETVSEPGEQKKYTLVNAVSREDSPVMTLFNRLRTSSELLRYVAYMCPHIKVLHPREHILVADLEKAEFIELCELRRSYFAEEFNSLERNKSCSRAFQRFKPFKENIFIRVGGRFSITDLPFENKYPIARSRKLIF